MLSVGVLPARTLWISKFACLIKTEVTSGAYSSDRGSWQHRNLPCPLGDAHPVLPHKPVYMGHSDPLAEHTGGEMWGFGFSVHQGGRRERVEFQGTQEHPAHHLTVRPTEVHFLSVSHTLCHPVLLLTDE